MDNIDKYYLISKLTDDNLEAVVKIIEMFQTPPRKKTIEDIEKLNLSKYANTLEKIMNLKVLTIKDISKCLGAKYD
jgi:hypothetical protein